MKIELLLENKILLSAKYIKLKNGNGLDKILIKKIDIKSINLQCVGTLNKDVTVSVSFKNIKIDYILTLSDLIINTNEIWLIGVLKDPLGRYHQGYIDNFKLISDKKEKIRWYELNNKQKYYYLRGCYFLGGIRNTIDNINPIITIDLSNVKIDLDVYYEIGKSFFKSYGYFGTEFHSFRDCLINIEESLQKREKRIILKIRGYKNFEKYFSNNILFNDFYEEFNTTGFEIQNV